MNTILSVIMNFIVVNLKLLLRYDDNIEQFHAVITPGLAQLFSRPRTSQD